MSTDALMTCPKCQRVQSAAAACHYCGLLVEHFDSFEGQAPSDEISKLWNHCLENWDDDTAHAALLDLATNDKTARIAVSSLYKGESVNPVRRGRCESQLETLRARVAAITFSGTSATPRGNGAKGKGPVRGIVIGLCLFAVVVLASYFLIRMNLPDSRKVKPQSVTKQKRTINNGPASQSSGQINLNKPDNSASSSAGIRQSRSAPATATGAPTSSTVSSSRE